MPTQEFTIDLSKPGNGLRISTLDPTNSRQRMADATTVKGLETNGYHIIETIMVVMPDTSVERHYLMQKPLRPSSPAT